MWINSSSSRCVIHLSSNTLVGSMETSHQIFDVTVEHLEAVLCLEAVLNNQVPISEYIYCQIIQYRSKFQD